MQGMYVDKFNEILGNEAEENRLLQYAKDKGFNYLTLYRISKLKIGLPGTDRDHLKAFIKKAKAQYGILKIGAVGETAGSFRKNIHPYNLAVMQAERFDVYNVEFEFWNQKQIDRYYGDQYLTKNGYAKTPAGALDFISGELAEIRKMTREIQRTELEMYVGWISEDACKRLPALTDRLLLAIYVTKSANPEEKLYHWSKQTERLKMLAPNCPNTELRPIFAATEEFMGCWLKAHTNGIKKAWEIYVQDYRKNSGAWNRNVALTGFQWYRYSDLRTYNP